MKLIWLQVTFPYENDQLVAGYSINLETWTWVLYFNENDRPVFEFEFNDLQISTLIL